ncbi:MAG TPA: hypothetical protein VK638_41460 [Edaphobacter sp.]|nr:hypothetical protein [Edaphobacter sp.]
MASRLKTSNWQVPPFTDDGPTRMGWIEEQLEEGEGWLSGQKSYKAINQNFRIFDAIFNDKTKSTLITNELKYDIRKFVETLSDMREIGTYGSDAPQYKPYAEMLNKIVKVVYLESQFPLQLRKAIQYAAVVGRGYLWPKCKTGNYGYGERQIIFDALGLLDVIPVQVPSSNNVKDAYANTIYEYMPIAEAHGRFPAFQSSLQPVERMKFGSSVQGRRVDYAEKFRYGDEQRNFGSLTCEIRYTFVRDIATNNYGKPLPMGEPGTSWFYVVPYIGQTIFGGFRNGVAVSRVATAQDCLIYPNLRLIISNKGMTQPMYDGPAFDWHGEMPCVQYDVDDWPWDGVGRALVSDVGSIQQTIRKVERKMDQVITTSLNPPMGYNRSATGGPKIENFDLFEEDVRAGLDGEPIAVFQSLLPESVRVTDVHFKFLEYLAEKQGKQLGLEDVANLANLKMNVASDTADKMLEGIGPVAKGIAGNIERSNSCVAYQLKFLVPQWIDTARIVSYLGPNAVVPQVFDFDPHSLIPSHLEDEFVAGSLPLAPSYYSQLDRAKRFAKNVRLISVPSTLLKVTQMQEQLKWLQLWRGQAPIAFADVAKKMDIDNYGDLPGTTLRERWVAEQMEDLKLKAVAAAEAQQLGLGGPPDPAAAGAGGGLPGQAKKTPGRKPSGQAPPKIKQKSDGRTTVTESN